MGKLFALKEWVTLDEACAFLSASLSEEVTIADLYRLALGRHLKLSVYLVNHARAYLGDKRKIRESDYPDSHGTADFEPTDSDATSIMKALDAFVRSRPSEYRVYYLPGGVDVLELSKEVVSIEGVWDLPMLGAERLDIEHALQMETGGPLVELVNLDGTLVSQGDRLFAQLLTHNRENEYASEAAKRKAWSDPTAYFPAGGLPNDAPIVVRPAELSRFLAALADSEAGKDEKPLQARERNNLLRIIRALAEMAKLPARGYSDSIRTQLQTMGATAPSDDTIRNAVEAARALDS